MNWQEYQEAVGKLYEKADGFGNVHKNITRPDKVTGRPRQVDVLVEFEIGGHKFDMLIDAKFHKDKIDVKAVESVLCLAESVGVHKAVIVASNGWTDAASEKAQHAGMDLMLLRVDEALEILVPDMWEMCPYCGDDCMVLDHDGMMEINGLVFLWFAGKCRECRSAFIWCQDCGLKENLKEKDVWECDCNHLWKNCTHGIALKLSGANEWITIFKEGIVRIKRPVDDSKQKTLSDY